MATAAARLFTPWWAVLLTLTGVVLCGSAGFWQLNRAAEKRVLQQQFATAARDVAARRLVADTEAPAQRYQWLRLAGYYLPEHQVLLDNLSFKGQSGYQVLTPFSTKMGRVLVNRGWLPAAGDRSVLPDVQVSAEPREVLGRIDWLPQPGLVLAPTSIPAEAPWPRRLLFPTATVLRAQTGLPLRDYQLLLAPEMPDGYTREWQPGGMGPERHLAYAVQWFGLAVTVVVIHGVLALRNAKRTP